MEEQSPAKRLMWVDYIIFFSTIVISLGIGLYQARSRQRTTRDYLMADRKLSAFPVAVSMMVSYLSAITILGNPSELHYFGVNFVFFTLGRTLSFAATAFIVVPLMFPLKLVSANDYLQRRFDSKAVVLFGWFLQISNLICFNGIVMVGPATMLVAMAGFPMWASMTMMAVVTTIYTSLGGLKAVVWTDMFQALVMLIGLLTVVIKGALLVGGFSTVVSVYQQSGRSKPELSPSLLVRQTVWGAVVGALMFMIHLMAFSQSGVQRYSSVPTLTEAKRSVYLAIIPQLVLDNLCNLSGVVTFAYFTLRGCDPLVDGTISTPNQILPYFVMEVLNYPGIPGLFAACVVSGTLSNLSASMSAATALTWNDILEKRLKPMSEIRKTVVTKVMSFVFGGLITCFGFVFAHLGGTLIQITVLVLGSFQAPTLVLFLMGALFPRINWKSIFVGAVASLAVTTWINVGTLTVKAHQHALPTISNSCATWNNTAILWNNTSNIGNSPFYDSVVQLASTSPSVAEYQHASSNETLSENSPGETWGIKTIYQLSNNWIPNVGLLVGIIVGLLSSLLPGFHSTQHDDPLVYFACIRRFLGTRQGEDSEYKMVATSNLDHKN